MLLAWSLTEVIRYSYYFFSLLSVKIPILDWLRYTTFYALYPLGASSEAFIAYSTLPSFENLPFPNWVRALNPLRYLMSIMGPELKEKMLEKPYGRRIMWNLLRLTAGAKGAMRGRAWGAADYARLVLFLGWWPGM
jgi:very-long-chain (3R)-3-hydroxyacyl-CoA dehydratase